MQMRPLLNAHDCQCGVFMLQWRQMDETRPILYGVADYGELRKADAWFVDRTAKIRDLEATRYAMFLRPRRFGKSLIVSMLQYYYDVNYKERFDALFGGTEIGANPTSERNKYLCLKFDFSAVEKVPSKVQRSFNSYAGICIDHFAKIYSDLLPKGLMAQIEATDDCNEKLNRLFVGISGAAARLYIIIDEYDNFTNTILAESGQQAYHDLCHGDGFFKQFFTTLKTATGGADAPVSRLFVTGVSPVTMDDVTSGFNIATNISLWPGIEHAALIELKYVKSGDPAPTPEELEKIKAEAIDQLSRYAKDKNLADEWHLNSGKLKVESEKLATSKPQLPTSNFQLATPL